MMHKQRRKRETRIIRLVLLSCLTFHLSYSLKNILASAFSFKNDKPTTLWEKIGNDGVKLPDRRHWLHHQLSIATAGLLSAGIGQTPPAFSAGLIQFPIGPDTQPLKNRYHFMRAGPSELEFDGIYSTNALFLTNRENGMHPSGEKLVIEALKKLKTETDAFPTIVFHSLAANGMDTGDLIARKLNLGREKCLPEFTYLDQRGIGLWDSGDEKLVKPAIWALDHQEAGKLGMTGRPPNNEDGTASETLNDQFIRLRQFISLQESRTSGDNILVIFPDGTGPALLSSMIAGIPYKDVHALEYAPGEIRLDISPESVRALFEQKKDDPDYLAALEDGKEKLRQLREDDVFVNLKELRAENESMELDAAFYRKKQEAELERLKRLEEERILKAEIEAKARLEKDRLRKEKLETEQKQREEREQKRKEQMLAARLEKERKRQDLGQVVTVGDNTGALSSMFGPAATGVLGVTAAIGALVMGKSDQDESENEADKDSILKPINNMTDIESSTSEFKNATLEPTQYSITNVTTVTGNFTTNMISSLDQTYAHVPEKKFERKGSLFDDTIGEPSKDATPNKDSNAKTLFESDDIIQDHLQVLAASEQALQDALYEVNESLIPNDEDDRFDGMDSFDSDWLRLVQDIRDEEDDVDEYTNTFEQNEESGVSTILLEKNMTNFGA